MGLNLRLTALFQHVRRLYLVGSLKDVLANGQCRIEPKIHWEFYHQLVLHDLGISLDHC